MTQAGMSRGNDAAKVLPGPISEGTIPAFPSEVIEEKSWKTSISIVGRCSELKTAGKRNYYQLSYCCWMTSVYAVRLFIFSNNNNSNNNQNKLDLNLSKSL